MLKFITSLTSILSIFTFITFSVMGMDTNISIQEKPLFLCLPLNEIPSDNIITMRLDSNHLTHACSLNGFLPFVIPEKTDITWNNEGPFFLIKPFSLQESMKQIISFLPPEINVIGNLSLTAKDTLFIPEDHMFKNFPGTRVFYKNHQDLTNKIKIFFTQHQTFHIEHLPIRLDTSFNTYLYFNNQSKSLSCINENAIKYDLNRISTSNDFSTGIQFQSPYFDYILRDFPDINFIGSTFSYNVDSCQKRVYEGIGHLYALRLADNRKDYNTCLYHTQQLTAWVKNLSHIDDLAKNEFVLNSTTFIQPISIPTPKHKSEKCTLQ